MKTEQLNQILHNLNSQLVSILVKLEPDLKKHHWAKNPCFQGVRFLIEKALPLLNKAGENEIKQLYDLAKLVKNYFKQQSNSKIFATCYVFINSATVDSMEYSFDFGQIQDYFSKTYRQVGIKANYSEAYPFDYIMIDQQIDGFTKHTFLRFTAEKNSNGEIIIYEQTNPCSPEPDLLADLDSELKISRKELIEAVKNEFGRENLFNKSREIKHEFAKYANEVSLEYEKLIETFETLENILNSEIEIRKNSRPASYIRLPFDDEKKKQEIIEFLFEKLNIHCFDTTKENFEKIFHDDKTFTKILWKLKPNLLVCLFTGYNFQIDGFCYDFQGIIQDDNKWVTLADKFQIKRDKDGTPLPKLLSNIKGNKQEPRELKNLLPIIEDLKKIWRK